MVRENEGSGIEESENRGSLCSSVPMGYHSLRVVRECVQELEEIAELKEVDVWKHPELMRRPTIFSVYINDKELPEMLGYLSKELIIEEIRKAAGLEERVDVTIKPLTFKSLKDEVELCTKYHTYMTLPTRMKRKRLL